MGNKLFTPLLALTAIALLAHVHFIAYFVPEERTMGIAQKIFYFHVPSAYAMYLGATVCFVGSAMYIAKQSRLGDALARAGAEVAMIMGLCVLTSGPLWAKKAWGVYWTWDAQLTTSLLSFLVYVAYVVLRAFAGGGDAERKFAAVLGVLGAANLPIIHFAVRKWGGTHPQVVRKEGGGLQHPNMVIGLLVGFLVFTLLAVLLIWARTRQELARAKLDDVEEEAIQAGIYEG
jgi:heme exporter protein C